jgi:low temperature requirement protein LtrA
MYHNDGFEIFINFFVLCGLLLMGVTVTHVFDTDPATNTGLTFLTGYLSSRFMYSIAFCVDMYYIPELRISIANSNFWNLLGVIIYLPLYAFPCNGEKRVEDIKYLIWGVASFITIFTPLLQVFRIGAMKNYVALNIEHFTERMGLFVVLGNSDLIV